MNRLDSAKVEELHRRGCHALASWGGRWVAIVLGVAAAPALAAAPQIPTVTTYTGTDENFANPERGFSQAGTSPISQNQFNNWRNQGYTLVRYQVDLRNFRTQPLSTTLLNQVNTDFTRARTAASS